MNLLLLVYIVLFTILSIRSYRTAFFLLVILLPGYLLRFYIGPLPTTLLEINFLVLFFVWLFRYARTDLPKILIWIKENKKIAVAIGIFSLAATVSIFIGNNTYKDQTAALIRGLGIWRAFFVEPIALFCILKGRLKETTDKNFISRDFVFYSLIISSLSISLLAIAQQFVLNLADPSLWDDNFNGRSTSFFTSPNAIGLFVAPLIPLMVYFFSRSRNKKERVALATCIVISILAIIFAASDGAMVGLAAGALVFALTMKWRKLALVGVATGIVFLAVVPKLQQAVFFQDKAGQNRLTLWNYTADFLTQSPQNFIFGTGLRKFFHSVQQPNYDPKKLERLNYPHNFVLNFWSETGLFGALSFLGILYFSVTKIIKERKKEIILAASLLAVITIIAVHGLVDVPYFKNDLAMLFWLIVAAII